MITNLSKLAGAPLTLAERKCIGLKSRGLTNNEIARQTNFTARRVCDYLLRARHKLRGKNLEHAVSIYTEAAVLRRVAEELQLMPITPDAARYAVRLQQAAQVIDHIEDPKCVHGLSLYQNNCEDCPYEKPSKHAAEVIVISSPYTGRHRSICVRCRRAPSDHRGEKFQ